MKNSWWGIHCLLSVCSLQQNSLNKYQEKEWKWAVGIILLVTFWPKFFCIKRIFRWELRQLITLLRCVITLNYSFGKTVTFGPKHSCYDNPLSNTNTIYSRIPEFYLKMWFQISKPFSNKCTENCAPAWLWVHSSSFHWLFHCLTLFHQLNIL